jgi:RNA polymerase sigma-70 factor (ECF subfamily)
VTRIAVQTAEDIRALASNTAPALRGGASGHSHVSSVASFDTVYAQNVAFVWRVLRGMGVSDAIVEDAVQDVFVVVHRRLAEFDGRHAIRTWLFAIAYRVARDHVRRSRRVWTTQEPLENQLRDAAPMPDESAERTEALRVVSELLDQLDDEKRAVLVLAEIEGMTAQEIADATGAGLNTVYTRLRRARLALNKMLAARQKRTP